MTPIVYWPVKCHVEIHSVHTTHFLCDDDNAGKFRQHLPWKVGVACASHVIARQFVVDVGLQSKADVWWGGRGEGGTEGRRGAEGREGWVERIDEKKEGVEDKRR